MSKVDFSLFKELCAKTNFAREQYNDACANARARERTKDRDPEGYSRAMSTLGSTMSKYSIAETNLANAVCREVARIERETSPPADA